MSAAPIVSSHNVSVFRVQLPLDSVFSFTRNRSRQNQLENQATADFANKLHNYLVATYQIFIVFSTLTFVKFRNHGRSMLYSNSNYFSFPGSAWERMTWGLRTHCRPEFLIDTGQSPEDMGSQAEHGNQERICRSCLCGSGRRRRPCRCKA